MTQSDLRYLDPVLAPTGATFVEASDGRARLLGAIDDESAATHLYGLISQTGQVFAVEVDGERVICEGEIKVHAGRAGWEPTGEARLYTVDTDDLDDLIGDVRRLFLAHSLRTGAVTRFAGWRGRVVALVPEEVGPKESTILRTLADGSVDATHTYNVLDAYGTYAGWVHDLAMEFGTNDDVIGDRVVSADGAERSVGQIVQAWLMREAADAELQQARFSLQFGLAGHARMLHRGTEGLVPIAELARSLYTDRPNLTKVVKAAERDGRISTVLDAIESGDSPRILAAMRDD